MSDTPPASEGASPVTVLFFAQVRHAAGVDQVRVDVEPGLTVQALARRLESEHPGLVLRGCLCAVDETYAEPRRTLLGGETVAFLPPVSGG